MSPRRAILVFGLVVLLFDGLWVTLARVGGARSASLGWLAFLLTLLIYAAAGLAAAARSGSVAAGASVGVAVGAIDAILGGVLVTLLGGGRLSDLGLWVVLFLSAVVGITLGALFGTIGAALAPVVARRVSRDEPAV